MGTHAFPAALPPRGVFLFSRISTERHVPGGSGIAGQAAHGIPCPNTAAGQRDFPRPGPSLLKSPDSKCKHRRTPRRERKHREHESNCLEGARCAGKSGKSCPPHARSSCVRQFWAAPSMLVQVLVCRCSSRRLSILRSKAADQILLSKMRLSWKIKDRIYPCCIAGCLCSSHLAFLELELLLLLFFYICDVSLNEWKASPVPRQKDSRH